MEAIFEAEQQIEVRRSELSRQIDELHSRITTNTKEIMKALCCDSRPCGLAIPEDHSEILLKHLNVLN